jgi:solute carrier family 25 phosphate transporter 23/24/25/41
MREEGWRSFFKGNGTNVLKIAPETAVKFWAYERLKQLVPKDPEHPTVAERCGSLSVLQFLFFRLVSGSAAGVASQSLIYPLEITKTRLAIATKGEYTGIRQCLGSILRNEGAAALFKGTRIL